MCTYEWRFSASAIEVSSKIIIIIEMEFKLFSQKYMYNKNWINSGKITN